MCMNYYKLFLKKPRTYSEKGRVLEGEQIFKQENEGIYEEVSVFQKF